MGKRGVGFTQSKKEEVDLDQNGHSKFKRRQRAENEKKRSFKSTTKPF